MWTSSSAVGLLALAGILILALTPTPPPVAATSIRNPGPTHTMDASFATLPLYFEAIGDQEGDSPGRLTKGRHFVARRGRSTVSLTAAEIAVSLRCPADAGHLPESKRFSWIRKRIATGDSSPPRHAVIRWRWLGANEGVEPTGVEPLPGRTNLLIGNDTSRWQTNVQQFAKVRYEQIYDGIDLLLYGNPSELEYDFLVEPGADPATIRLAFQGADGLQLDAEGNLLLQTPAGVLRQRRPHAYQILDGREHAVQASYRLDQENTVTFEVGRYAREHPLVIDPVLVYSTYLGGSNTDLGHSIAVDSEGNAYITGQVSSINFPRTPAFPLPQEPDEETSYAFVTKLDSTGRQIIYSTIIGGSEYDIGNQIAVDAGGSAYVIGETRSDDFPVTPGVLQRQRAGDRDAFIAKLAPDGAALVYSTFLGGEQIDLGNGIALGTDDSAYVTGITQSADFPTSPDAYKGTYARGDDVFVAKLSSDAGRLLYSTYIGGSGTDIANKIAVDRSGNAYIVGLTDARRATGVADAYCLKLDSTGSSVLYTRLFGGTGVEEATAVTVDAFGNAYVSGLTFSKDFPTTPGAFQRESASPAATGFSLALGFDAFVVKIDPRGENLLFSTYLNGSRSASGRGIALDQDGNIVVGGFTASADFPVTAGALAPPADEDQYKSFLAKLNAQGSELMFATRFGGANLSQAWDMAVGPTGDAYIAGFSLSPDLPVTEGAAQAGLSGEYDAFIVRFSTAGPPTVAGTGVVSGASFLPGTIAPGMIVSVFGTALAPAGIVSLQLNEDGTVKAKLAETRVLFNDVPAPLVFVSENQIGAIAPYRLHGLSAATVMVESGGSRSQPVEVNVAQSAPGLFTLDASGSGQGAIVNQDGTINGPENPAERGSVVLLFATGEGQTDPAGADGRITGETLPRPRLPVAVAIGGRSAEVLYAGGAPAQVAGVMQVNARVPSDLEQTGELPVLLQVGDNTSQPAVTLAVR